MLLANDGGHLFLDKKGRPVEVPRALAPLADTHGHLTSFRSMEPSEAIARASLAGVRLLVVPVDPADDIQDVPSFLGWLHNVVQGAKELLAAHGGAQPQNGHFEGGAWDDAPELCDNVRFLCGVHPYGARTFMEDRSVRQRMEKLLRHPLCVGVGEFGLDYGPWNELPAQVQMDAFREQLRMAHELDMPVELHIRDAEGDDASQAHADALRVLEEEGVPAAGCDLHCFTSGPEVMDPFVRLGCHIAFGGAATFARTASIRKAAARCPESLILSETDCPYMAPVPLRGRECEPAMVAFTVARVAQVREEAGLATEQQTYDALWHNANAFFGLLS